ncbi:unnamed protein product [Camellia sinensis]
MGGEYEEELIHFWATSELILRKKKKIKKRDFGRRVLDLGGRRYMGCFLCFDSREDEKPNLHNERDHPNESLARAPSNISRLCSGNRTDGRELDGKRMMLVSKDNGVVMKLDLELEDDEVEEFYAILRWIHVQSNTLRRVVAAMEVVASVRWWWRRRPSGAHHHSSKKILGKWRQRRRMRLVSKDNRVVTKLDLELEDDEVEECYAILRWIHVAVKYFEKGYGGNRGRHLREMVAKASSKWSTPLFEQEDFEKVEAEVEAEVGRVKAVKKDKSLNLNANPLESED